MKKILTPMLALAICAFTCSGLAYANVTAQRAETRAYLTNYVTSAKETTDHLLGSDGGLSTIATTITFSQYLTFDEFEKYMDEYELEVVQFQVRGLAEDGTRITVFTSMAEGFEVAKDCVDTDAAMNGYEIVGITDVYAYISADKFELVSADAWTFLADATSNITTRTATETTNSKTYFPKSLTWELEDLDLLG